MAAVGSSLDAAPGTGLARERGRSPSALLRGFGWVSAPVHQIVGVDLQLPGFLSSGKLTISTLSATRQGMMPNHPWRVLFTGKQLAEFQALHEHLMAAIRR